MSFDNIHFECKINGRPFVFIDCATSKCCRYIESELNDDCYGIGRIPFKAGDIVVDIGGHVGMFSIPLIMRFPFITIHSFEPLYVNYLNFRQNIVLNSVIGNLRVYNLAITKDGRDVEVAAKEANTGSGSILFKDFCAIKNVAHSVTLESFLDEKKIDRVRLLKMDCEGAELEIVQHSLSSLRRVDFIAIEVHKTKFNRSGIGYSSLIETLSEIFPPERLAMKVL